MTRWPDSKTGYIEVAGGPRCGNCKYLAQTQLHGAHCVLPVVDKTVDPKDGCCSYWDDSSGKAGILAPPGDGVMSRLRRRR